jgi:hypothetical protein
MEFGSEGYLRSLTALKRALTEETMTEKNAKQVTEQKFNTIATQFCETYEQADQVRQGMMNGKDEAEFRGKVKVMADGRFKAMLQQKRPEVEQ